MLVANSNSAVLTGIVAVLVVISVLLQPCPFALAQTDTRFTPADKFNIPAYDGNISFAVNGSYADATLENDVWTFTNLWFNNSEMVENLAVSARNSNVTIVWAQVLNTTLRGAFLSYMVEGQGTQTFNFDLKIEGGEWSVLFNEDFIAEGEGWTLSLDHTLTVTGANGNVTLMYILLEARRGNNANLPFYEQHSVAIATGATVAVMVALTVGVKAKRRKDLAAGDL
jgi:hypothetical protein